MALRRSIITDQLSMDFGEALSIAARDFHLVEIHSLWNKTIEDIDDDEARRMELLLKRYSVGVSCLSTTLYLMCPLYTSVENLEPFSDKFLVYAGTHDEHLEALKRCLELAARLGADVLRVFPFRAENGVEKDFPEVVEDMSTVLADAVALAEKHGKCLAVENCPYSYLPRGNMTFELAERVGSPSFRLLYDVGNSYRAPSLPFPERFRAESLVEEYGRIKDMVRHFHFKDYRKGEGKFLHAALGEGDIDYAGLTAMIRRDGLEACVSLEPEVDQEGVMRSIRNLLAM